MCVSLSLENASMAVNTGEIKRMNRMDFSGKNQDEYAESCPAYLLSVCWGRIICLGLIYYFVVVVFE